MHCHAEASSNSQSNRCFHSEALANLPARIAARRPAPLCGYKLQRSVPAKSGGAMMQFSEALPKSHIVCIFMQKPQAIPKVIVIFIFEP